MELLMIFIIFSLFISFGVCSVLFESRAERKGANWGFHVVEKPVNSEHPIDAAYRTTNQFVAIENSQPLMQVNETEKVEQPTWETTNLIDDFEISEVDEETQNALNTLMNAVNESFQQGNDNSNVPQSDLENIEKLIGPKVASLITAVIANISTEEEIVIFGTYEDNKISYNGASIATIADIICDPDDYIVLKGHMLPNGEFRVLAWEDAQTIEYGFAGQNFIITSKTA